MMQLTQVTGMKLITVLERQIHFQNLQVVYVHILVKSDVPVT